MSATQSGRAGNATKKGSCSMVITDLCRSILAIGPIWYTCWFIQILFLITTFTNGAYLGHGCGSDERLRLFSVKSGG